MKCGSLVIRIWTPGPQTIYRAEMAGILVAASQADRQDEICLDNASAVGCSQEPPSTEAIDYDMHEEANRLIKEKQLTVRWVRSHRDPAKATSYADYLDRVGNTPADRLANEGGNMYLQKETVTGKNGDILAHGIIMPWRECHR